MLWAVNNGFIGVNATYRLAPQSPYPAGAEEIAAIVAWVSEQDRASAAAIPRASI